MFWRLTLVCLLVLLSISQEVGAATLYIDPAKPTLNRGDAVTLSVRLDTDEAAGECINAIDGVISYNDAINPVDISLGESILPIWIERPTIDKEKRQITFAGGIPNGYCGRVEGDPRLTNTILQLVFRAPGLTVGGSNSTVGTVSFAPETKAYLNDGFGGEAVLQTLGAELTLNQTVGNEIVDEWRDEVANDIISPEAFSVSLERDEFAYDNKYYIVFNTTDKQSGISHYEVIEELPEDARLFSFGAATAPWVETKNSVYILNDQTLRSTIRVRAVDKAGNEYVATLPPKNTSQISVLQYTIYAGGVAGVLLLLVLVLFILRRRKRSRTAASLPTEDKSSIIN